MAVHVLLPSSTEQHGTSGNSAACPKSDSVMCLFIKLCNSMPAAVPIGTDTSNTSMRKARIFRTTKLNMLDK